MAAFTYHVQGAAPATYLADTSSSPIHHNHIVAAAQQYQASAGFTDVPASSSSCLPYYSYSPYPVPYYDPVKSQESRGSVDDSAISPPPSSQQQVPEEIGRSGTSASQGTSMGAEKKRRQGKADEASNKTKKQRKCGGSGRKSNTNKGSTAASNASAAEASLEQPPQGYIHVRARRGQATDSHSLAERVRREKISARMKLLQGLVPGCDKVTGKALMLDEIINYVQSLQHQVEFLSMKLASLSPVLYDFGPDLDVYMAQMQKVERLSPSPPAQPDETGGRIAVQTSSAVAAAAAFAEAGNSYNNHPVTATVTEASSIVPYLLHGCHQGLPTPASYSPQDSGSSSLMQVVAGDSSTQQFLQQLQFAANNLCSYQ